MVQTEKRLHHFKLCGKRQGAPSPAGKAPNGSGEIPRDLIAIKTHGIAAGGGVWRQPVGYPAVGRISAGFPHPDDKKPFGLRELPVFQRAEFRNPAMAFDLRPGRIRVLFCRIYPSSSSSEAGSQYTPQKRFTAWNRERPGGNQKRKGPFDPHPVLSVPSPPHSDIWEAPAHKTSSRNRS